MTNEEAMGIMSQMIKDEEEFLSDNTVEAHKMAIKALEQQPCDDAQERYEDLCEYFGDAKDILKSRKDFKAWLERIKWHIRKAEELYEKYENKQEPCEDAISRKSIKQKLQEHHDFFINAYGGFSNLSQNGKSRVYEITNCISMVVNEPPVTPQQKTGHWIKEQTIHGWDGYSYQCSECGRSIHIDIDVENLSDYPYCHCGAKMQESEEQTG